jgi:2-keto-4-pentenoate hydratase/2-oxohepta-3-ene-1,7-dioic acid hydratase in catechol pathway
MVITMASEFKIVRFLYDGEEDLGYLINGYIIPFKEVGGLPKYLSYPFAGDDDILRIFSVGDLSNYKALRIEDVKIVNPIRFPGKIVCVGLNYMDHVKEGGREPPRDIVFFMKPRTALAGPFDTIYVPRIVKKLDYEGELAVVIGKRGRNIPAEEAYEYVLGYMIMNDVSARDFQFSDGQWTRGKGFDGFAPIGPWIVPREFIPDPHNLSIKTWLDGELRQDGNTRDMIFKIPDIIRKASEVMTLEPGDIISTGTPAGVGIFDKTGEKLIQDGSVVRIEIEKIGFIENRFRFVD